MQPLLCRGLVYPLLAALALLAGCASTPVYSPQGAPFASGYAQQRVDERHWRVEYYGSPRASRALVERYLLFRSAELTTGSGYQWFATIDHLTDTEIVIYAPPLPGRAPPHGGRYGDLGMRGPVSRPPSFDRFVSRQTIEMGLGAAPPGAFNASAVEQLLAPAVLQSRAHAG